MRLPADAAPGAAVALPAGTAAAILAPLSRLRRRARLYLALEGVTLLLAAMVAGGLVQLVLDRALRLNTDQRALLNVVLTVAWLAVAYRYLVVPLSVPLPLDRLAARVDRACPELADRMVTAVQFLEGAAPGGASPQVVAAVLREAAAAAGRVDVLRVLNHRRAAEHGAWLVFLGLVVALALSIMPGTMEVWFRRNWLLEPLAWPQQTYIVPIGFAGPQRRAPRGEELRIEARIFGRVPQRAVLEWRDAQGRRGRTAMVRIGADRLVAELGPLVADVHFRIRGGDERTREYTVQAVERPRVVGLHVRIDPPPYTGLAPLEASGQTALSVPRGSRVRLRAVLNKPVVQAHLNGPDGRALAAQPAGPQELALVLDDLPAGRYRFALRDADGLRNVRPLELRIAVLADRPPEVELELAGAGESVTPLAVLPVRVEARDDYGLTALTVHVQRNEAPPVEVRRAGGAPPAVRLRDAFEYAVRQCGAVPGDRLRIWASAADTDPSGPNAAQSEVRSLRVVSQEEFLLELGRRELQLRYELEQLLAAQRTLAAQVEDLLARLGVAPAPSDALRQRAALGSAQRTQAARAEQIARRLDEIRTEMQISRAGGEGQAERLAREVIDPLRALAGQVMPQAAVAIAALPPGADPAQVRQVRGQQSDILRVLEAVLDRLRQREDFRQAVALLAEIIAQQRALHAATLEQIERELRAILGEPAQRGPAPPDNP